MTDTFEAEAPTKGSNNKKFNKTTLESISNSKFQEIFPLEILFYSKGKKRQLKTTFFCKISIEFDCELQISYQILKLFCFFSCEIFVTKSNLLKV